MHIRFATVLSQCVVMFPKTILETRQSIFSFKEIVMRAEFLSVLFNRILPYPPEYLMYIVRRNSVLVISPMGLKALTPMSDQDRISPYNINTLSRPIYLLKHITYLRIRNWSCTKLPARILRIVKSYQGKQTLQITTSWNTLFLKVRFKFYQIHNVEFCKEKRKENPPTAVVLQLCLKRDIVCF